MKPPRVRFRLRTLIIAVALSAGFLSILRGLVWSVEMADRREQFRRNAGWHHSRSYPANAPDAVYHDAMMRKWNSAALHPWRHVEEDPLPR